MFHWIEIDDKLICAETGANFYKADYVPNEYAVHVSGIVCGSTMIFKTESERELAWQGIKAKLGILKGTADED